MNKIPPSCAATPLEKDARRWLNSQGEGYDNGAEGAYKDLEYGGCSSGMVGHLTYTKDCVTFFMRHRVEINAMLYEAMENAGANGPADLFGEKWDRQDPLALDDPNRNLLAWFGFETAASLVWGRFENAEETERQDVE